MKKWKGAFLAAVLAVAVCLSGGGLAVYADPPKEPALPVLNARAAVLIDGDSGRVLAGKNEDARLPMASTTKIMTCILALESGDPDASVAVSDYAASMPDVQLHIRSGESYRLEDLLYSLMLESHNDAAVAIAEHIGGSVKGFAEMMNEKAEELGCRDTYFITPNGLDASEEDGRIHSTTARDLALILRYCIRLSPKREEFLAITRAPSHTFSDLSGSRSFSCVNHNALLTSMDGAVSGKTGFTNGAGYCYVGAVERGERLFIAALLGCGWPPHKTWKWQDMRRIVEYGEKHYEYRAVHTPKPGEESGTIRVENGILEVLPLQTDYPEEGSFRFLLADWETVTAVRKYVGTVKAPVAAGTLVGETAYYANGKKIASFPVRTTGESGAWTAEFCVKALLNDFLFCYTHP